MGYDMIYQSKTPHEVESTSISTQSCFNLHTIIAALRYYYLFWYLGRSRQPESFSPGVGHFRIWKSSGGPVWFLLGFCGFLSSNKIIHVCRQQNKQVYIYKYTQVLTVTQATLQVLSVYTWGNQLKMFLSQIGKPLGFSLEAPRPQG